MNSSTNLGEIKKLARMFVYLDIQDTEYSPLIVKHPFTDSGVVAYRTDDGGIAQADITADPAALKLWREEKIRQIKEARTPHEISFMVTKSYSLAFLKYAAPHLSSQDLSEMLADVWVRTESPNNDPNTARKAVRSLPTTRNSRCSAVLHPTASLHKCSQRHSGAERCNPDRSAEERTIPLRVCR